jgi:mitochondrial FAD-linked sulfhydryl oxidase
MASVAGTVALSKGPFGASSEAKKEKLCEIPACNSTKDMFKNAMTRTERRVIPKGRIPGCPWDKDALGSGTWELIHAVCANFPETPSHADKARALEFFRGLAHLYPCPYCAKDFQEEMDKSPPVVESREALMQWACRQHNIVNQKLGKPAVVCDIAMLDERYKTGHPSCFVESEEE